MKAFVIILLSVGAGALGASVVISAFSSGELSPRMQGRADYAGYYKGATTMENLCTLPQGAAMKRPGNYYIADANTPTNVRIIDFEASTEQSYVIEIGHEYLRFFEE